MDLIAVDLYSSIMALNTILIEKGVVSKEELKEKTIEIRNLMIEYLNLLSDDNKQKNKEENLQKATEILKKICDTCKVYMDLV